MEKALELITGIEAPETTGCGRTDTGVHAADFYLHTDFDNLRYTPGELVFKLNRVLPVDIAVKSVFEVEAQAHARFDAIERSYEYRVHHEKNPFIDEVSVYLHRKPDYGKMNEAAALLLKHTDFASFCKAHAGSFTTLCNIRHAQWHAVNNEMIFYITADRFLRNMVRAVTGTLLQVGYNTIDLAAFEDIILSKDRQRAGESVPAHGLSLTAVKYPSHG